MSYCVNCGVRLAESEKKCPLCGVVSQNPLHPFNKDAQTPYPQEVDTIKQLSQKRWLALMVSFSLVFSAVVCFVVNYIYDGQTTWSLYVIGAVLTFWVFTVVPLLFKKEAVISCILLDALSLSSFLWLCDSMVNGNWFISLGLPIIGVVMAGALLDTILIKAKAAHGAYIGALFILTLSVMIVGIEAATDNYVSGFIHIDWSLLVMIPCVIVALLFCIIARNQQAKEQLRRKLHF